MDIGNEIHILNIDDVLPNRFQPRISFDDKHINELSDSIKEHGVIQPIVVRKLGDKYEIIAGERRYKASIIAGKTTIPAIITSLDDEKSAEVALIENVQRQDLSAIEEAISYKKILDMGYLTQNQLADKLGRSQSTIANKLRLLNLDEDVQEALLDGKISERHARSLLRLPIENQVKMLNKIMTERLTVRNADKEINKLLENVKTTEIPKVEEKETKKMNDQIFEKYNIPTSEIKEEPTKMEFVDLTKTAEIPKVEEKVNPGFMDIEKIEETAEDIFKPEEKPADVEKLLEETEETVESPMAPIPTTEESKPAGNRFFTMFDTPSNEENFVENLESVETNMDFGVPKKETITPINPIVEEPKVEEVKTEPETSKQPELSIFDIKYTVNEISEEPEDVKSEIIEETKENTEVIEYPVMEEVTTDTEESEGEEKVISPVMPEPILNNDIVKEDVTPSEFNVVNTFSLNDDEEFESTLPNIKTEEVVQAAAEPISEVKEEPKKVHVNNFQTAINTIRNCADTLERFGFKVDVDEMDLENEYQVTFKINK